MIYQVKDWDKHFENNKSRERSACSFVCVPNKQHGMGFCHIMSEPDGAMIYGIWAMILGACSQQCPPRAGWLTRDGHQTGTAWAPTDMAVKFRRPVEEVERALEVLSSDKVGWLTVIRTAEESDTCSASARLVPAKCPPSAPEENRREEKRIEGREYMSGKPDVRVEKAKRLELAKTVLSDLNMKAGKEFRLIDGNLTLIAARLAEVNNDVDGIGAMVTRQCALWKLDTKMNEFLRPETLFGKTKFQAYYDNRNQPVRSYAAPVNKRCEEMGLGTGELI